MMINRVLSEIRFEDFWSQRYFFPAGSNPRSNRDWIFMELVAAAAALLVLVSGLCIFCVFRSQSARAATNLPPGPPSLPLIGHLHLVANGPAPHILFMQLARKYGPLTFLKFGSVPVILASSKDAAREFLREQDAICASRPPTAAGRIFFYGYQDIAMAPYGDKWRKLRRLCTLQLFTAKRLESFQGIREDELKLLLESLRESAGRSVVDMREKLSGLSFNTISRMLMNKRFYGENEEGRQFMHALDEAFSLLGRFAVGDYIPFLRWLDIGKVEQRFVAVRDAMGASFEKIIQEHERRREQGEMTRETEDFIDLLLRLQEEGEECLQSRETFKAVLSDLFGGGTDTSSVTLEWALAELVKSPKSMARLYEEVNGLDGDFVSEADAAKLPYLNAVVRETFRLHPAIPLLPPHLTMDSCKVMGYNIDKGSMIFLNAYAIGRDPSIWEDPLEFKPERFLEGNQAGGIDVRGHDFELIPFGSGRRVCPGLSLALTVVRTVLANLVRAFEWRMPPGEDVDTVNEQIGLTVLMAKRLQLIPFKR